MCYNLHNYGKTRYVNMREKIVAICLILSLVFTAQWTTMAELGDLGADWEYDTFGANIAFYHETYTTEGKYELGEPFVFITDTYCSRAKNAVGKRDLTVKPFTGTAQSGVGTIGFKDKEDLQWKDITGYNVEISFANNVDQYFRVTFLQEGTYVISNSFLSNDHSTYVACRTRYITIKDGKFSISFDAPEVEQPSEEEGITIEGYQISGKYEGYRIVASALQEIDGKQVTSKGIVFALWSLKGTEATGVTEDDMTVQGQNPYVLPVEATQNAEVPGLESSLENGAAYAMTMKFGVKTVSAFTSTYAVRGYVELEDGSIRYGKVYRFSIMDIAKKLYEESKMLTEELHQYLYQEILTVVSPDYEEKLYENHSGLLSPDALKEEV